MSLRHLLVELVGGESYTARELANAALEHGYMTSSKKFVNNVTTALNTDKRFVKNDGRWCLKDAAT